MKNERVKTRLVTFWKVTARPILIFVLVMTAFRSAIADWNDVPTGSMKPTIVEGDRVLVNKLAYDLKVPYTTWHLAQWSHPKRGDIVVFYSPYDGTRLVKRVVGLPGDRVEMVNERLIINGTPAKYEPLPEIISNVIPETDRRGAYFAREMAESQSHSHAIMLTPSQTAPRTFEPFTVAANSYFMMGDNRDNSFDSRFYGPVPRSKIIGQATSIVISLDRNHYFLPRWTRFFNGLE
jgi:signal peptidase I